MFHVRNFAKSVALAGVLVSATMVGARAWDADGVTSRLKAVLVNQGVVIDWRQITPNGSSINIQGLTAKLEGAEAPIELGDVVLEDVTEDDSAYRIGQIEIPPFSNNSDQGKIAGQDLSFSKVSVPKDNGENGDDQNKVAQFMRYEKARLGSFKATTKEGQDVFTLTNLHAEMQPEADDGTLTFDGAVDAFLLDLDAVTEEAPKKARLAELGYSQIKGHMSLAGSWRPSDGHVVLTKNDLAVDKAGTLGVSLDLSGYTPQFMQALQQMREQMKASDDNKKAAKGLAMLGLLQQLTLNGVSIHFTDDGFTTKMLAMAAEKQHTEPDQLIDQVAAIIPLKLSSFMGAEFAATVAGAVKQFLQDPGNIEIRAQPDKPQPFALIMGAAMSSPKSLPGQLGLDVIANK